jgi:outer membrane lipase/esterase
MKSINLAAAVSALALAVAAPAAAQAQQSSGESVNRVVVFGDSLSDGGFFRTILPLPPGAGRFTTNPDLVSPSSSRSGWGSTSFPLTEPAVRISQWAVRA